MAEVVLREPAAGLAEMIAGLASANLAADPARERLLATRRGAVEIAVADAGVTVDLRFSPGSLTVSEGAPPDADLRISADAATVLALTSTPLRAGLPDPSTPEGRDLLRQVLTGRLRVRARPGGVGLLLALTRLLSVA